MQEDSLVATMVMDGGAGCLAIGHGNVARRGRQASESGATQPRRLMVVAGFAAPGECRHLRDGTPVAAYQVRTLTMLTV